MNGLHRHIWIATAAAMTTALVLPASAQTQNPSAIYVFGDSLSDRGNLAEVYYHHNLPNPPSAHDSFTNGDVAVQVLAQRAGLTTDPSLWVTAFQDPFGLFGGPSFKPGTNYAVAGATAAAQATGGPAGINLPQQVAAYSAHSGSMADPNALYTFIIGGNDVRNAALYNTGSTAINAGVQAELAAIQALANEGAKNFLVVNVPNIGAIPEFTSAGLGATGTALTQQYNSLLSAGISSLTLSLGETIKQFDLYSFASNLTTQLAGAGYDVTDPCYTGTPLSATTSSACGANAQNIGKFYYWDSIHPTAAVDAQVGNALADFEFGAASPTPEPATWAMIILGFGVVGYALRRRQKVTTRVQFV